MDWLSDATVAGVVHAVTFKTSSNMNASFLRKIALTAAVVSSSFALNAIAGPGPQYWQALQKSASSADQTVATAGVCPGSQVVPITAMKPAWANGKGPLVETQIGTKRVCTVCPVTRVTRVQAPNGRGPSTVVQTVVQGAQHDCTTGCPAAKG